MIELNAAVNLGMSLPTADGKSHGVALKPNALCTHTMICGATNSGKTGAIIGIVEEMVRLGVPCILADFKGDLANIALQPEGGLRDQMSVRFLTPGADHGEPVNIFSGIANPERITSTVTMLFKMLGVKASPSDTQHAFLSTIIQWRLKNHTTCTIKDVLTDVMDPPFEYLGMRMLDDCFPKSSQTKLANKINNLLAAPSFQQWREGVAIDIPKLLTAPPGKIPVVIYSVAHLVDDQERSFAVSMFLEELQSWMRTLPGTNELKTLILLDEMYGVMPPHPANPPTKKPLLTMLKQARAYGLGVVICSQNPMDLDYKGMGNAQTWLVGRLQTANDRRRIVEGICASTSHDDRLIEQSIARLQPRQFLLVRPTGHTIYETRDTSAKLVGPMAPAEIKELFKLGLADAVFTLDALRAKMEEARSVFDKDKSGGAYTTLIQTQEEFEAANKEKAAE